MKESAAEEMRQSMKITLDEDHSRFGVYAYQPGEITIIAPDETYDASSSSFGNKTLKTEAFSQSLIVMPHCLISDWPPRTIDELEQHHFEVLFPKPPQILLMGTGESHRWPEPQVLATLTNHGVAVEVMETAAACRTFAILASDGRDIAAALLVE